VCLLPKTDDHVWRLKMLENDIAEMGGDAVILEAVALDRVQEERVVARFKADRDDAYVNSSTNVTTSKLTSPRRRQPTTSRTTSLKRTMWS